MPTSPLARPAAVALAVALAVVLAVATSAGGETVRTFPADCPNGLQLCIFSSAPGDVIRLATATPIDEDVLVDRPLTLEAAPGGRPRIAAGRDLSVLHLAAAAGTYTVRGLTFERGSVGAVQAGAGAMDVRILDNVVLDAATGPFGAIDVTTSALSSSTGPVTFEIRGNDVTARALAGRAPVGIRVEPGTRAAAAGLVAGNRVTFPDAGTNGDAILLRNATRDLTADVIANAIAGVEYDSGVTLEQREAGGRLTARVANNVIRGGPAEDTVAGVRAESFAAATLRAAILHNTIVDVNAGVDVFNNATEAVFEVVVAHNVLAAVSDNALDADTQAPATLTFGPNLLFAFDRSHLPAGTIIADPRFPAPDDLRPGPGSPAIDAGVLAFLPADLTTDFAGNPRLAGGAPDLGAFESPCPDGTFPPGACPVTRPPAACPAGCDDGDPCTADVCRDAVCAHVVLGGLDGARCACERDTPAACAADAVPRAVRRRTARACTLLERAGAARRPARLLRRAARAWAGAARLAARRPRSSACRSALTADLRDAARRTTNALDAVR